MSPRTQAFSKRPAIVNSIQGMTIPENFAFRLAGKGTG
jgi:hypothetical protein